MTKKNLKEMKPKKRIGKKEIVHRVVNLFNKFPKDAMNYKQVSAEIGVTTHAGKQIVLDVMQTLFYEDFLIETERGKYKLNSLGSIAEGKFEQIGRAHV